MLQDVAFVGLNSQELILSPERHANWAFFMLGTPSGQSQKANVKPVTLQYGGYPRLFLHASKNIKKGDILYWNYKARGTSECKDYKIIENVSQLEGYDLTNLSLKHPLAFIRKSSDFCFL